MRTNMNKINMLYYMTVLLVSGCGASRETAPDGVPDGGNDSNTVTHMDAAFPCTGKQTVVNLQLGCYAEDTKISGMTGIITDTITYTTPAYLWIKDDGVPVSEYNGIVVATTNAIFEDCSGTGQCVPATATNFAAGDCIAINNTQWGKSASQNYLHWLIGYDNTFKIDKLAAANCSGQTFSPVATTLPQLQEYTQAFDGVLLSVPKVIITGDVAVNHYKLSNPSDSTEVGYMQIYSMFAQQNLTEPAGTCLSVTGYGFSGFSYNQGYFIMPRSSSDLTVIPCQ